ncbi:hypothetical protein BLI80_14545 [Listeria monocytogenes]|nr:hypothetical protein [Listeria monocytogenes]HAA4416731.1 hypothetical protein [Listeria monocytogenes]
MYILQLKLITQNPTFSLFCPPFSFFVSLVATLPYLFSNSLKCYHKKLMHNQKCNEMSDSCHERLKMELI